MELLHGGKCFTVNYNDLVMEIKTVQQKMQTYTYTYLFGNYLNSVFVSLAHFLELMQRLGFTG